MNYLPIIYFKSTIICLDDNKIVLDSLRSLLSDNFHVRSFDNIADFDQFINTQESCLNNQPFLSPFNESEHSNSQFSSVVKFDLSQILSIANNQNKHNEISVLVIDYLMPKQTGIEVCESLSSHQYKKLLLTGNKEYKVALDALNHGIINHFLEKDTDIENILNRIVELSYLYFEHITSALRKHLETTHKLPLSDTSFVNYMLNLIRTYKIKEYYLIDKNGSLLLVDENNHKTILAVHTERSITEFINNFGDINEIQNIIKQIKQHKLIPWLGIAKDSFSNKDELAQAVFKPTIIEGNERYYIHHIVNNNCTE